MRSIRLGMIALAAWRAGCVSAQAAPASQPLKTRREFAAIGDTAERRAWHPGGTRTSAPGTQAGFGALVEAWIRTGAECPA